MALDAAPAHATYERPWLYPKQQAALFDCTDPKGTPSRLALVEATTKAGKTSACLVWLLEQALRCAPNQSVWWIAPVYGQAKIAFRRMKAGLPQALYVANQTDLVLTLANGALIQFRSAEKPDNLYGDDVFAAVIDEASRVREEAWHAVRSTLTATKGPARIIGNVKGRKNWFFRLAREAEKGSESMSYAKLTALDAVAGGILDPKEIEDARRVLPEAVFRELYMAEPSDDEGNPFGFSYIAACTGPLSLDPPVAIGVDLAKSVDWTVIVGLDKHGRVCGFERWQRTSWADTTARLTKLIGHRPALVDSTGVGDPIVEALQAQCSTVRGFHFSAASKQKLMEGLSLSIQSRELRFPPGPIRLELEAFEFQYTRTGIRYSAPEGSHDDCVMALALANQLWREMAGTGTGAAPLGVDRVSPWIDGSPGGSLDELDDYLKEMLG